jgi:two-component system LytT family response regulator
MTSIATALIADDEPLARRLLREMLDQRSDVRVIAEAADGRSTVEAVLTHNPDLVFLDIQMPEIDGFGVLQELKPARAPGIVFVTAFDRYALRAFDAEALDYLLKPFDADRLDRAVKRALARRAGGSAPTLTQLSALMDRLRPRDRLPLAVDGRVRFVETSAIDWLEAEGKVVHVHVGRDRITVRQSLTSLLETLDPLEFVRVHRSAVVNLASVREVQPWFHGDYVLLLRNGAKISSGRAFRDDIRRLIRA